MGARRVVPGKGGGPPWSLFPPRPPPAGGPAANEPSKNPLPNRDAGRTRSVPRRPTSALLPPNRTPPLERRQRSARECRLRERDVEQPVESGPGDVGDDLLRRPLARLGTAAVAV